MPAAGATPRSCASTSRHDAPLHLIFVPFLSRSHFAPLAAQAAAAAAVSPGGGSGSVTILTTPHFAALAPASVRVREAPVRFPVEDFSLLPEDDDGAASAPAFFAAAQAALAPALAEAVRAIIAQDAGAAVAVVSDAVLHWSPGVARECGVPHVTFHTIGAFAAAAMVASAHLHRPGPGPAAVLLPGGFPAQGQLKLRRAHVDEQALAHLPIFRAAEAQSHAVVFNTFSALEADFAEYYRTADNDGSPTKVFLVGPRRTGGGVTTGSAAERDPILQWLDGQEAGSVVYACFGSTCGLSSSQLKELAAGLRASGMPFLWVIPTMPTEDLQEERASRNGMVVAGRWAPQGEILAHGAVGGFVSHCGWNSALDALCAGVPLATWPLRADQFLNEALLVDVLRVGVRVREVACQADGGAVVPAEAVAGAVGKLMASDGADEAAGRKARVKELAVAARAAVEEGGSSCGDWTRLVDELKALHGLPR
ncbi:UDP-glycosyltransferase 73C4 [Brachypodium distachyon]|uniref:UDP-glycosyltransferase 73C4 n=1 Tax=Brachypodium distachyon TaxID=15368 RepID=UPI0001C74EAE|nr:UDP-glycosyltransferase 73C4 [Brachypodium distachyon]|eukprot:XP_003559483.1 UDP-glycosyltransferase 73C4 [Brachypodium distachyon]